MKNEIRNLARALMVEPDEPAPGGVGAETTVSSQYRDKFSVNLTNISSILFCLSSIASNRLFNPGSPPSLSSSSRTCPTVSGMLNEGWICTWSGLPVNWSPSSDLVKECDGCLVSGRRHRLVAEVTGDVSASEWPRRLGPSETNLRLEAGP